MNSRDLKTYKHDKISKSNFFTITIFSLHSIGLENKNNNKSYPKMHLHRLKYQRQTISIYAISNQYFQSTLLCSTLR